MTAIAVSWAWRRAVGPGGRGRLVLRQLGFAPVLSSGGGRQTPFVWSSRTRPVAFFRQGSATVVGGRTSGLSVWSSERVKSDSWPTACLLNGLRKQNIWQLVVQEEYLERDRYRNRIELYDASRSRMTCCECRSLNNKKQQNCVFLTVWYCYLKSTGNGMFYLK